MRNFFHNISDVLMAAIIVVIAACIIFWRINVILQYPGKLAGAANKAQVEAADNESDQDNASQDEGDDTDQ